MLGRPSLVGWSLVVVYLASMAAIPGIAATLLDDLDAPPLAAAFVLLTPGLLLVHRLVYAEAPQIALILLACVFEARGRRPAAVCTLALAILVKETSALALVPWMWSALRRRDVRLGFACVGALAPYALWSSWVRIRLGQFPFLTRTPSRSEALSLPGVGIRQVLVSSSPNHTFIVTVTVLTFALGVVASWAARRYWIGAITGVFTLLTACFGRAAMYYVLENLRLLSVPTVLAIICLVLGWSARTHTVSDRPAPL